MKTLTLEDPLDRGGLTYVETDTELTLASLNVRKDQRMKGVGGALLDRLCVIADEKGLSIYLTARPLDHGPTTLPLMPLKEFYGRRGFKEPRDGRYSDLLIRRPVTIDCNG